ncbi:Aste57867_9325 [Aphanomyces stellatus]|uniref:Aste57867_9325 protein n=1 Tax=Aphanomyces stellatus TaxID=120398 RepID=A0A485KMR2_9STRA|nr:hypothetical protein As57867_009289 [Aphanomyces stellatus]VFT86207.1 Aste57867_9325 [Aphanomyces stellatus]
MGVCCSVHATEVTEAMYAFEGNAYIGKGTHSKVFHAKHKASGDDVAIKMIPKAAARQEWRREVAVMKMLDTHPNIVELKGTYETEDAVCLVMEYAAGGELFQLLIRDGAYSEDIARSFAKDTLTALAFLHDQGIVHGDLKPENLLVTSKHAKKAHVKLADFGMAAVMTTKQLVDKDNLTWAYCAPEVLAADAAAAVVDAKGDMWAAGVLLYILLSATHPFDPDGRCNKAILVDRILHYEMVNLDAGWEDVSVEAKDLIRRLLDRDPTTRLAAADALRHPWFLKASVPTLPLQSSLRGDLNVYMRGMETRFRVRVSVSG